MPDHKPPNHWFLLAAVTFLSAVHCSKPKLNAPTEDFARRNQCPASTIESRSTSPEEMLVMGCGKTELYVKECGTRGALYPPKENRQPLTEAETKYSSPNSDLRAVPQGCAWTRKRSDLNGSPKAAQQPKWLSEP